ncbi:PilN domain-containing protein [uncultured Clostridium sp.]|jgi:Tfp pilus assembly protein PilN|uniref:PilN domain-containing protein n=1 Tax=uncultured Clostridium sp. TaxID=59620 RepID=UPI00263399B3|nr:PilN domain-containing protein [uncultured Clostridium sp.]
MIARDINFFAPYVKEHERSTTQTVLMATAAVVMIGISGTLGYNMFQEKTLVDDIKAVTTNLDNSKFIADHKEAELVILEKGLLQGYNTALMTVHDGIIDRTIIDTAIVKQINSTVPSGANLKSLAIQGGTIVMNVTAKSDKEAADMKYNLDKLPMVKESFIPSVNSDFGAPAEYSFSITCVLEEVYNEN